jgi:hypothetical protein
MASTNTYPLSLSLQFQSTVRHFLDGSMKRSDNNISVCRKWLSIDILSIPAMSAEPEPVSSAKKHSDSNFPTSGACRSHTVERGECLKSWIKSGITQGIPVDELEGDTSMAV